MKRLYLIRHAKSSWSNPDLDDFARPLNKRGKVDCPEMAARLGIAGICPDLIVASPAKRAKKTAICMAKGTGYNKNRISYDGELYLGSISYHLRLIGELLSKVDVMFLVGHNHTMTELCEYLTGSHFNNVPTCGIVGVEYSGQDGFTSQAGAGRLLFFDFPKNQTDTVDYK
ncbi:MAG: histidine phosphatase family protein [Desulfobulbaceae bacterium]|nr:histidine phosphatase family protein [Desulfobulbaceae bacterium]